VLRPLSIAAVIAAACVIGGCSSPPPAILQAPPAPVQDFGRERRIAEAESLFAQAGQAMAMCQANEISVVDPTAWESLVAAYDSAAAMKPTEQPDALARQSQFVIDEANRVLEPLRTAAEQALVRAQDGIAAVAAEAGEGDETLVALRAELEAAMQAANTDGNYRASKERYDAIAAKAAEGSATALKARATALIAEIEKNLETARYNGFREKNATEWEAVRDGKNLLLPLLQEAKYRMVITDAEPLLERSKSLMD